MSWHGPVKHDTRVGEVYPKVCAVNTDVSTPSSHHIMITITYLPSGLYHPKERGIVSTTQVCVKRLVLQFELARKLQPPDIY